MKAVTPMRFGTFAFALTLLSNCAASSESELGEDSGSATHNVSPGISNIVAIHSFCPGANGRYKPCLDVNATAVALSPNSRVILTAYHIIHEVWQAPDETLLCFRINHGPKTRPKTMLRRFEQRCFPKSKVDYNYYHYSNLYSRVSGEKEREVGYLVLPEPVSAFGVDEKEFLEVIIPTHAPSQEDLLTAGAYHVGRPIQVIGGKLYTSVQKEAFVNELVATPGTLERHQSFTLSLPSIRLDNFDYTSSAFPEIMPFIWIEPGQSGGPLFSLEGNKMKLFGIASSSRRVPITWWVANDVWETLPAWEQLLPGLSTIGLPDATLSPTYQAFFDKLAPTAAKEKQRVLEHIKQTGHLPNKDIVFASREVYIRLDDDALAPTNDPVLGNRPPFAQWLREELKLQDDAYQLPSQ